jgi:HEAT repeat protein
MSRHCLLACWALFGLALLTAPGRAQEAEYLGKGPAAWAEDLSSKDPAARRSAVFALGKLGTSAAPWLPRLLKVLREDQSAEVRETAAFALGEIGKGSIRAIQNGDLVPTLAAAVTGDADPLVRRSAAVALGEMGSDAEAGQPALEKAVTDKQPEVRQNAAWALGRIGPGGVMALSRAMTDRDPLVVRDAANSLGLLKDKARPALLQLLAATQNPDTEVKKAALGVLVNLVGPTDRQAYAPLQAALTDRDVDVRRNAALALGNMGGEEASVAVGVLLEALQQKTDKELRQQAAAALKNIGPFAGKAVNALRAALADSSDPGLRKIAALALGGLKTQAAAAVPDLLNTLANPKEVPAVRVEAAVALQAIGNVPAAKGSIPKLVTVLRDPSNPAKVRERTMWALRAHAEELPDHPEVFDALNRIVLEPRTEANRMLRYDSAYILGYFQRAEVAKEVLDVLAEFLKDTDLKIYTGTKAVTGAAGATEKAGGGAGSKELGKGDGRVMAVQALRQIGGARVKTRPDIMRQLQALRDDTQTFIGLREVIQEALGEFKESKQ